MAHVAEGFSAMEDGVWLFSAPVIAWDLGKSAGRFGENEAAQNGSK